ncbi:MAG: hypothetical protein E7485_01710 [Ruminococcaceae bacterium]|nr:hypothetical protein [Oscillospiraceae bacterium]
MMIRSRKGKKHCNRMLIKQGGLKILSPEMKYYLYEHEDGRIYCETLSATFNICESKEEYEKLSEEELESRIYSGEMSIAR